MRPMGRPLKSIYVSGIAANGPPASLSASFHLRYMQVVRRTKRSGVFAQPTIARFDNNINIVLCKSFWEALSDIFDMVQDLLTFLN